VGAAAPVGGGPGAALGLLVGQPVGGGPADPAAEITVHPALSRVDVPLTNILDNSAITATYFRGRPSAGAAGEGEVVANPAEPVLPLARYGAAVPGAVLRGVGFRGGTYADLRDIVPHTSAPATEASSAIGSFISPTFYPSQNWSGNQFGGLADGGPQLMAVPAQYQSDDLFSLDGTLRTYSELRFRLYYLDEDWTSGDQALVQAGLAPAPQVGRVTIQQGAPGTYKILVNIVSAGAPGVQEVWITYTAPPASGQGSWQSIDLVRDPNDSTLWSTQGFVSLPATALFMVQAASGAGLVGLDTNGGAYYRVVPPPPGPAPDATRLTAPTFTPNECAATPAPCRAFGRTVNVRATLERLQTTNAETIAGRLAYVVIGAQLAVGRVGADGAIDIPLRLAQAPGTYAGRIAFPGAPGLGPSVQRFTFRITKDSASLAIAPASVTVDEGDPTGILATLRDSAGQPIANRTVAFAAFDTPDTGGAPRFVRTVKTGIDGVAALGAVPWPAGTYHVRAYFATAVPLPGGTTQTFIDVYYNGATSGISQLVLRPALPPPTVTATVSGTRHPSCPADCFTSATVTLSADQPGAAIFFSVNGAAEQPYTGPLSFTQPGTYDITFYAVGANGAVGPTSSVRVKIAIAPVTDVLDTFTQRDGKLGAYWSAESQLGYRVRNQQVDVEAGGPLYWSRKPPDFGPSQEAHMRLTQLDGGGRHGLLLKVVNGSWKNGAIRVSIAAGGGQATVEALNVATQQFVTVATFPLAQPLPAGTLFAVRALADGSVQVFVNCALVGTAEAPQGSLLASYAGRSGRIGAWFVSAPGATFDDFGGGTVR
ncbi:MAG TPA: hypothetical protein VNL77_04620, partial [Roseiflexaceae bacterium]|nr:hypothetical protein [Roseiflexaceae bacterium]